MVQLSQLHILLLVLICSQSILEVKTESNGCSSDLLLDLAFVVDASGSICNDEQVSTCDNWEKLLSFMQNLTSFMTIGTDKVRVALIQFDSSAWIKWNLTTYSVKQQLLDAIHNLRYTGGNTNTPAALELLSTVFSVERGDRPGVRNTAILITDGKPSKGGTRIPMDEVRAAVNKVTVDQGIRLLVVGVTDSIDMDTLKVLSSPPHTIDETVFLAKDYQSIDTALKQLQIQTCKNSTEQTLSTPGNLCTQTLDLCFVVDASGSICDSDEGFNYQQSETCNNWEYNVKFIADIVSDFNIGMQATRVGLVIFSSSSYVAWNLTAITDKTALLGEINNLAYKKGGRTDMTGGLNLMRTKVFGLSDDRPNITNTAIIITDGYPTNASTLQPEIDAIRQNGIRTLVVGVTNNTDLDTIKKLASQPPTENVTYFRNLDYATLEKHVRSQLSAATCDIVSSTTPKINIDTDVTGRTSTDDNSIICTEKLDLCFVVDASGSICDSDEGFNYQQNETCNNWDYNVKFIADIVSDFDIGMQATRVGLVIFSSSSYVAWNLTGYTDKLTLMNAITSLTYRKGGTTDMTGGLRLMRTQVFGLSDDRPDVPNTAIIITDGYPTVPATLQAEIDAVNRSGIRTLVVGVTNNIQLDTIINLSSPPKKENETYFLNADYMTLEANVRSQLSTKTCDVPPTSTTTPSIIISSEIRPSTPTGPNQCTELLDLCFVVDASGSICDSDPDYNFLRDETCNNWQYNVDFIADFVNDFDVGLKTTRIGLVIFSSQASVMWNLTAYTDTSSLKNAIKNLVYHKGGTTDMTGGLRLMRTEVFGLSDDRPNVTKTAIIITDGFPTVSSTLQDEIDAVNRSGIRTLVVGVTNNTDLSTIQRLASPPAKENVTYFFSADYKTLKEKVKSQLSTATCNLPPTVPDPMPLAPTPFSPIIGVSTPPTPPTNNSCVDVNLCILVDASGSICDSDSGFVFTRDDTCNNWHLILQFVHKLVDDVFSSTSGIGLVKFSTQAETVFDLTKYTDKASLLSAVDNITYIKGGTTDMTGALHLARTEVFNTAGPPKTAVIITDGFPTQPSTLQAEIDAARNSSIRILALGVTDQVDESTIRRLSAPPQKINETYFMALQYVDIESFRKLLQERICQPSR